MLNGIKISKDAFLKAGNGDINKMRDAQREMLFDGILGLDKKIDNLTKTHKDEYASKKDVKWLSRSIKGLYALISAILLYVIQKAFNIFSG